MERSFIICVRHLINLKYLVVNYRGNLRFTISCYLPKGIVEISEKLEAGGWVSHPKIKLCTLSI
jgi:hypothetical protein